MSTNLELFDYINGILSTIAVLTGVIVGLIICSKYIKYKRKNFLLIGTALMGMFQPWWPTAISFISILITGRPISVFEYFFYAIFFYPFFLVAWMMGISNLLELKRREILPIVYLIISVLADIYLVYFLINDPSVIGTIPTYFDAEYKRPFSFYLLFILSSLVITGILFSIKSLKSEDREIRWKGKLLIIGFLCYLASGFLDVGYISFTTGTLIIARLVLISSAFFAYFGFFLPGFLRKRL